MNIQLQPAVNPPPSAADPRANSSFGEPKAPDAHPLTVKDTSVSHLPYLATTRTRCYQHTPDSQVELTSRPATRLHVSLLGVTDSCKKDLCRHAVISACKAKDPDGGNGGACLNQRMINARNRFLSAVDFPKGGSLGVTREKRHYAACKSCPFIEAARAICSLGWDIPYRECMEAGGVIECSSDSANTSRRSIIQQHTYDCVMPTMARMVGEALCSISSQADRELATRGPNRIGDLHDDTLKHNCVMFVRNAALSLISEAIGYVFGDINIVTSGAFQCPSNPTPEYILLATYSCGLNFTRILPCGRELVLQILFNAPDAAICMQLDSSQHPESRGVRLWSVLSLARRPAMLNLGPKTKPSPFDILWVEEGTHWTCCFAPDHTGNYCLKRGIATRFELSEVELGYGRWGKRTARPKLKSGCGEAVGCHSQLLVYGALRYCAGGAAQELDVKSDDLGGRHWWCTSATAEMALFAAIALPYELTDPHDNLLLSVIENAVVVTGELGHDTQLTITCPPCPPPFAKKVAAGPLAQLWGFSIRTFSGFLCNTAATRYASSASQFWYATGKRELCCETLLPCVGWLGVRLLLGVAVPRKQATGSNSPSLPSSPNSKREHPHALFWCALIHPASSQSGVDNAPDGEALRGLTQFLSFPLSEAATACKELGGDQAPTMQDLLDLTERSTSDSGAKGSFCALLAVGLAASLDVQCQAPSSGTPAAPCWRSIRAVMGLDSATPTVLQAARELLRRDLGWERRGEIDQGSLYQTGAVARALPSALVFREVLPCQTFDEMIENLNDSYEPHALLYMTMAMVGRRVIDLRFYGALERTSLTRSCNVHPHSVGCARHPNHAATGRVVHTDDSLRLGLDLEPLGVVLWKPAPWTTLDQPRSRTGQSGIQLDVKDYNMGALLGLFDVGPLSVTMLTKHGLIVPIDSPACVVVKVTVGSRGPWATCGPAQRDGPDAERRLVFCGPVWCGAPHGTGSFEIDGHTKDAPVFGLHGIGHFCMGRAGTPFVAAQYLPQVATCTGVLKRTSLITVFKAHGTTHQIRQVMQHCARGVPYESAVYASEIKLVECCLYRRGARGRDALKFDDFYLNFEDDDSLGPHNHWDNKPMWTGELRPLLRAVSIVENTMFIRTRAFTPRRLKNATLIARLRFLNARVWARGAAKLGIVETVSRAAVVLGNAADALNRKCGESAFARSEKRYRLKRPLRVTRAWGKFTRALSERALRAASLAATRRLNSQACSTRARVLRDRALCARAEELEVQSERQAAAASARLAAAAREREERQLATEQRRIRRKMELEQRNVAREAQRVVDAERALERERARAEAQKFGKAPATLPERRWAPTERGLRLVELTTPGPLRASGPPSVASLATTDVPVPDLKPHAEQRAADRKVDPRSAEFKRALRDGTRTPINHGGELVVHDDLKIWLSAKGLVLSTARRSRSDPAWVDPIERCRGRINFSRQKLGLSAFDAPEQKVHSEQVSGSTLVSGWSSSSSSPRLAAGKAEMGQESAGGSGESV